MSDRTEAGCPASTSGARYNGVPAMSPEGTVGLEDRGERTALDELHPDADPAFDAGCAMDRHDVRMPDARQQAPFFDRVVGVSIVAAGGLQQLECDLPIDRRIPGAV